MRHKSFPIIYSKKWLSTVRCRPLGVLPGLYKRRAPTREPCPPDAPRAAPLFKAAWIKTGGELSEPSITAWQHRWRMCRKIMGSRRPPGTAWCPATISEKASTTLAMLDRMCATISLLAIQSGKYQLVSDLKSTSGSQRRSAAPVPQASAELTLSWKLHTLSDCIVRCLLTLILNEFCIFSLVYFKILSEYFWMMGLTRSEPPLSRACCVGPVLNPPFAQYPLYSTI